MIAWEMFELVLFASDYEGFTLIMDHCNLHSVLLAGQAYHCQPNRFLKQEDASLLIISPRGKTNNVVSEQVPHKPACTSIEKS